MKTSNNNQQTTGLQFFSDKNSNANIRMYGAQNETYIED